MKTPAANQTTSYGPHKSISEAIKGRCTQLEVAVGAATSLPVVCRGGELYMCTSYTHALSCGLLLQAAIRSAHTCATHTAHTCATHTGHLQE